MLKDFDMEVVLRQNFYDFFSERRHNTDDIQLLHRMKAFHPRRVSHLAIVLHAVNTNISEWVQAPSILG